MSGTFVGHPLDTVRVRMVSAPDNYRGVVQSFGKIIRNEGLTALFKGVSSPCVGAIPAYAGIFASKQWAERYLILNHRERFTDFQILLLSGAFSGFFSALLNTPIEYVKI